MIDFISVYSSYKVLNDSIFYEISTANINKIHFGYVLNGSRKAMKCDTKYSTAMVDKRTYDIVCNIQNAVTSFLLYGEGVKSLCSLYISAGMNKELL